MVRLFGLLIRRVRDVFVLVCRIETKKYFCKIAGVNTLEAEVSPKESVEILKQSAHLYYDLRHPHLVKIIEDYEYNQFYVTIFEWAKGECLFDHWNFDKYQRDTTLKKP